MELILREDSVRFDATDIGRVFHNILEACYNTSRKTATDHSVMRLTRLLKVSSSQEDIMHRLLVNWSVLVFSKGKQPALSTEFKSTLKRLLTLKCTGTEEEYIRLLQQSKELRNWMESLVQKYLP